jgi:hypothetical protein
VTDKTQAHHQTLIDEAELQRRLCRHWLLGEISGSRGKTKNDLRAEAIERFKLSKSAFERAWTSVTDERGHHGRNDSRRRAGIWRRNPLVQIS